MSKVNEGVSTQRESRVDVLRNLFNRFKRLDNKNVQQTFDRLTDISNELQALGATDITDHEVVKKLLRSLDSSFDTLALMIQEHGDYKSLDPADILERLSTHEFQQAEKRDLYGPSYGRSRALKAKAISSSEGEESDSSLGDPEELSQELAMLVRKFQKFSRRGRFGKSSKSGMKKSDSSSSDYKKRTCHKCKKYGHFISECPLWEKESRKKKYKDDSSDDSKKMKKSSKSSSAKSSSSKSSSHKNNLRKARALIGKEMDSEEESEEYEEEEESKEESDSGVASLALATAFVSKSIFNDEENGNSNDSDVSNDDYAPTYCFMAKGAKVLKHHFFSKSSDGESEDYMKPSYSKLANIATKQQSAIERLQKLLDKSNDLLNEEMDHTQTLTNGLQSLQSKFDNLQSRHGALLVDHEKLSYEFLQRKQDLEKLRVSHEDLQRDNESLLD